jgi:hypothetical protein
MGKAIIQADYEYVDNILNQVEEQKQKIQELEEQLDFVYEFFKPTTKYKYIKAQNGNWYEIDKDDRDWNSGLYFWQLPNRNGLWTKFIPKGEK